MAYGGDDGQPLFYFHGVPGASVSLWQGEADNWAPIAMSMYLQERLRTASAVTRCTGQAHTPVCWTTLTR